MQTLYYGGPIIPMTRPDDHPEALVVREERVAFVGPLAEARAFCRGEVREVSLEGKTLMPGFVDPHGHISLVAQFTDFAYLGDCTDFPQILRTLNAFRRERGLGEGDVIVGYSYDHNFLKEQAHPTRELLDQVSETIPVCILHTSSHMCVVNTALLQAAGITRQTPDPRGGRFGRDSGGEPDGYVEEVPAMEKVLPLIFSKAKTDPMDQMGRAEEVYLKHGITTIQEGAGSCAGYRMLEKYAASRGFRADVVSYIMADDLQAHPEECPDWTGRYKNRLKPGGVKIVLDGSPQGRSAWLTRPYEGEKDYRGYPAHSQEQVDRWVADALARGRQILAHCNGDAAADQFIRAVKGAGKAPQDVAAARPVMIHCQTVRDDQLEEMARIGMIPSFFAAHTYYWGDVHLKNLGRIRGARISPVKKALELGLKYNFHQDPPVVEPDMLHSVWCAVNRITRGGKPIGPDQRIGVYDALKGVTINAAYAYFEEDQKGSLEVGKLADLVILDENPLTVDPEKIKDIGVLQTIKEGNTVFSGE